MAGMREALGKTLGAHLTAMELDELDVSIREAWPAVSLDTDRFADAVLNAWDSGGRSEPISKLALVDLYLARACLEGNSEALKSMDSMLRTVSGQLARSNSHDFIDEVMQRVRLRLLVAVGGEPPKLSLYRGRGALIVFLRVVAMNVLRNLKGSTAREVTDADHLAQLATSTDLESRVADVDRQQKFREAFRLAVVGLSLRERSVLRLNLLEGLSIDDLAPMYRVHRSTMARWLADARQALAAATREQLAIGLRLTSAEAEQLLSSLQSRFDLTLSSALRETADADER